MTFSIVARSGDADDVAVASKFIAVGSVVPTARLGVGAITTQPVPDEVRQHLWVLSRSQPDLRDALEDWADEASFEMRMTPDGIDSQVLRTLREADA